MTTSIYIYIKVCAERMGKVPQFHFLVEQNRIFLLLISMYNSIFYCVNHKSFSRKIEKNNYLFFLRDQKVHLNLSPFSFFLNCHLLVDEYQE